MASLRLLLHPHPHHHLLLVIIAVTVALAVQPTLAAIACSTSSNKNSYSGAEASGQDITISGTCGPTFRISGGEASGIKFIGITPTSDLTVIIEDIGRSASGIDSFITVLNGMSGDGSVTFIINNVHVAQSGSGTGYIVNFPSPVGSLVSITITHCSHDVTASGSSGGTDGFEFGVVRFGGTVSKTDVVISDVRFDCRISSTSAGPNDKSTWCIFLRASLGLNGGINISDISFSSDYTVSGAIRTTRSALLHWDGSVGSSGPPMTTTVTNASLVHKFTTPKNHFSYLLTTASTNPKLHSLTFRDVHMVSQQTSTAGGKIERIYSQAVKIEKGADVFNLTMERVTVDVIDVRASHFFWAQLLRSDDYEDSARTLTVADNFVALHDCAVRLLGTVSCDMNIAVGGISVELSSVVGGNWICDNVSLHGGSQQDPLQGGSQPIVPIILQFDALATDVKSVRCTNSGHRLHVSGSGTAEMYALVVGFKKSVTFAASSGGANNPNIYISGAFINISTTDDSNSIKSLEMTVIKFHNISTNVNALVEDSHVGANRASAEKSIWTSSYLVMYIVVALGGGELADTMLTVRRCSISHVAATSTADDIKADIVNVDTGTTTRPRGYSVSDCYISDLTLRASGQVALRVLMAFRTTVVAAAGAGDTLPLTVERCAVERVSCTTTGADKWIIVALIVFSAPIAAPPGGGEISLRDCAVRGCSFDAKGTLQVHAIYFRSTSITGFGSVSATALDMTGNTLVAAKYARWIAVFILGDIACEGGGGGVNISGVRLGADSVSYAGQELVDFSDGVLVADLRGGISGNFLRVADNSIQVGSLTSTASTFCRVMTLFLNGAISGTENIVVQRNRIVGPGSTFTVSGGALTVYHLRTKGAITGISSLQLVDNEMSGLAISTTSTGGTRINFDTGYFGGSVAGTGASVFNVSGNEIADVDVSAHGAVEGSIFLIAHDKTLSAINSLIINHNKFTNIVAQSTTSSVALYLATFGNGGMTLSSSSGRFEAKSNSMTSVTAHNSAAPTESTAAVGVFGIYFYGQVAVNSVVVDGLDMSDHAVWTKSTAHRAASVGFNWAYGSSLLAEQGTIDLRRIKMGGQFRNLKADSEFPGPRAVLMRTIKGSLVRLSIVGCEFVYSGSGNIPGAPPGVSVSGGNAEAYLFQFANAVPSLQALTVSGNVMRGSYESGGGDSRVRMRILEIHSPASISEITFDNNAMISLAVNSPNLYVSINLLRLHGDTAPVASSSSSSKLLVTGNTLQDCVFTAATIVDFYIFYAKNISNYAAVTVTENRVSGANTNMTAGGGRLAFEIVRIEVAASGSQTLVVSRNSIAGGVFHATSTASMSLLILHAVGELSNIKMLAVTENIIDPSTASAEAGDAVARIVSVSSVTASSSSGATLANFSSNRIVGSFSSRNSSVCTALLFLVAAGQITGFNTILSDDYVNTYDAVDGGSGVVGSTTTVPGSLEVTCGPQTTTSSSTTATSSTTILMTNTSTTSSSSSSNESTNTTTEPPTTTSILPSRTVSLPPAGDPPKRARVVQSAATASTAALSFINIGNPATATAMRSITAVGNLVGCSAGVDAADEALSALGNETAAGAAAAADGGGGGGGDSGLDELGWDSNPLMLRIGSDSMATYKGAVLSNIVVLVGFVLASYLFAWLRALYRRISFSESCRKSRVPGVIAVPMAVCLCPLLYAGLVLCLIPEGGNKIAGAAGCVFALLPLVSLYPYLGMHFSKHETLLPEPPDSDEDEEEQEEPATPGGAASGQKGGGGAAGQKQKTKKEVDGLFALFVSFVDFFCAPTRAYEASYSSGIWAPVVESYSSPAFGVLDLGCAFVATAASAIADSACKSRTCCAVMSYCTAVSGCFWMLLYIIMRPALVRFDRFNLPCLCGLQTSMSLLAIIANSTSSYQDTLEQLAEVVYYLSLVCLVVATLSNLLPPIVLFANFVSEKCCPRVVIEGEEEAEEPTFAEKFKKRTEERERKLQHLPSVETVARRQGAAAVEVPAEDAEAPLLATSSSSAAAARPERRAPLPKRSVMPSAPAPPPRQQQQQQQSKQQPSSPRLPPRRNLQQLQPYDDDEAADLLLPQEMGLVQHPTADAARFSSAPATTPRRRTEPSSPRPTRQQQQQQQASPSSPSSRPRAAAAAPPQKQSLSPSSSSSPTTTRRRGADRPGSPSKSTTAAAAASSPNKRPFSPPQQQQQPSSPSVMSSHAAHHIAKHDAEVKRVAKAAGLPPPPAPPTPTSATRPRRRKPRRGYADNDDDNHEDPLATSDDDSEDEQYNAYMRRVRSHQRAERSKVEAVLKTEKEKRRELQMKILRELLDDED